MARERQAPRYFSGPQTASMGFPPASHQGNHSDVHTVLHYSLFVSSLPPVHPVLLVGEKVPLNRGKPTLVKVKMLGFFVIFVRLLTPVKVVMLPAPNDPAEGQLSAPERKD